MALPTRAPPSCLSTSSAITKLSLKSWLDVRPPCPTQPPLFPDSTGAPVMCCLWSLGEFGRQAGEEPEGHVVLLCVMFCSAWLGLGVASLGGLRGLEDGTGPPA